MTTEILVVLIKKELLLSLGVEKDSFDFICYVILPVPIEEEYCSMVKRAKRKNENEKNILYFGFIYALLDWL